MPVQIPPPTGSSAVFFLIDTPAPTDVFGKSRTHWALSSTNPAEMRRSVRVPTLSTRLAVIAAPTIAPSVPPTLIKPNKRARPRPDYLWRLLRGERKILRD